MTSFEIAMQRLQSQIQNVRVLLKPRQGSSGAALPLTAEAEAAAGEKLDSIDALLNGLNPGGNARGGGGRGSI